MANHGPAYGLSAEVQQKLEAKKDPALEHDVIAWIKQRTGEDASPLAEKLNDGLILCKLVNAIKPGIVKAGPAKMENINRFIEAAQKLGVKELDVFATVDLYEAKNMTKVIDTLATLRRVVGDAPH